MHCCMASSGRRFVIAAGIAMLVGGFLGERGPSAQATPQRAGAEAGLTANSQTFVDPTGDNLGGSPDITTVRASNDDAGNLELQLVIPNRTDLTDPDFIGVYVDTDRSVSTGCRSSAGDSVRTGRLPRLDGPRPRRTSFRCTASSPSVNSNHRARPLRARTPELSTAPLRPSLCVSTRQTSATLRGSASRCSRLPIRSVPRHPTRPATSRPGSTKIRVPRAVPPRDRTPPRVKALASTGVQGGLAKLRYTVFDESKRTREEITVLRGRRLVATKRIKMGSRKVTSIYSQSWRVPASVSGKLRFCVRAWDAAGNSSAKSCAPLAIR